MNTLPTKWYIQLTPENYEEVKEWWLKQVEKTCWAGWHLHETCIVLSVHPNDNSYYWCSSEKHLIEEYPSYQKITLEQFRQITNPTQKPMTKSIQISRELLNEYYDAADTPQREYLTEHFKLDGTTTDEAIRGLHDIACRTWKPRIKKNHPECFPEDSKYFCFNEHVSRRGKKSVIEDEVADSLGMERNFIQIRCSGGVYGNRSFYLSNDYCWELIKDGADNVLIPTKKLS